MSPLAWIFLHISLLICDPLGFDDEFADFVGAPVSPTTSVSAPISSPTAGSKPNLMDLLNSAPARPPMTGHVSQGSIGGGYGYGMGVQQPNYAASPPPMSTGIGFGGGIGAQQQQRVLSPTSASRTSSVSTPPPSSAKSGGGFDDLWKTSLGSTGAVKPAAGQGAQKSMRELGKEKAQAGIWGTSVAAASSPKPAGMGVPLGGLGGAGSVAGSGGDDLLL